MDDPRFWDDGGGGGARYNGRRERRREQEMQMQLLGASAEGAGSEGGDASAEEERSETRLLWELGWPLLIARVADEVSWLSIYAFWGQMGSAVSGAGYDAYTGMQFTLVFIFGAQQALYTMVPQATGAGTRRRSARCCSSCSSGRPSCSASRPPSPGPSWATSCCTSTCWRTRLRTAA